MNNKPSMVKTKRKAIEDMTKKELVKVLDREFSLFIRMSAADDTGVVCCITCGAWHFWNDGNLHNGHFISRSVEATRFNKVNCNPQCASCNSFKQGQHHIYRDRLIEIHGKDEVEKLERTARLGGKLDEWTLRLMIKEYREKVKLLKIEKKF